MNGIVTLCWHWVCLAQWPLQGCPRKWKNFLMQSLLVGGKHVSRSRFRSVPRASPLRSSPFSRPVQLSRVRIWDGAQRPVCQPHVTPRRQGAVDVFHLLYGLRLRHHGGDGDKGAHRHQAHRWPSPSALLTRLSSIPRRPTWHGRPHRRATLTLPSRRRDFLRVAEPHPSVSTRPLPGLAYASPIWQIHRLRCGGEARAVCLFLILVITIVGNSHEAFMTSQTCTFVPQISFKS